jgi:hypothetical protein
MTTPEERFERAVADLLADLAPSRPPVDLILGAQRAVDGARRWPRWLANLKERPMRYRSHLVVGSPTARVAAVAISTLLVAILSAGAFVVGAQSPSPAPPEMDTSDLQPAWVTGTFGGGIAAATPKFTPLDGLTRALYHWKDMRITTTDPRLSGTLDVTYNQDVYGDAAGDLSTFNVGVGTYRIQNDAGSWEGPNIFLNEGSSGTRTVSDTGVLVGRGAYEGLSAFLVFDFRTGKVVAAIFPGEMPPQAMFQ